MAGYKEKGLRVMTLLYAKACGVAWHWRRLPYRNMGTGFYHRVPN